MMLIGSLIFVLAASSVLGSSCPALKIGCFKHAVVEADLIHSDTQEHENTEHASGKKIDWDNFKTYLHEATCRCENEALKEGYKYFSLREFGECHGLRSVSGLETSDYCFHHSYEQCSEHHDRCVGADEGAYVFEVKKVNAPQFVEGAAKNVIFCEHRGVREIKCPDHHVIDIKSGYYGRKSSRHCGYRRYYNTKCEAGHSRQKIKELCNGRQSCRLNPHNGNYGDPCRFTVKYLDITYSCIRQPLGDSSAMRLHTSHFCEHAGARTINCGAGKQIKIRSGFYGRLAKICGLGRDYKCVAGTSESKIKVACDGKQQCTLNPHNAVYGDPCWGTRKYLEVNYSCINN